MKSIDKIIKLKNSFVSYRKESEDGLENNRNPIVFLHGTNSSGQSSFGINHKHKALSHSNR
ncbi:hypothetical protein [Xenorhabdus sp. Sc-CR9]|uniref:hypothetical protein n=1 Tax=Xenorhabdus sp. Sc-CR9 TaxID=2584468 RepID=UPI001F1C1FD3|nr:hypothetical protein [Xenorhabdus sp. Sc-CR9]